MKEATHIIRKTMLDFQYNGNTDGFALQKEVKEWLDELVAGLAVQLDGIVAEDEILSVDSLNVSIDVSNRDWKHSAAKQLLFQLRDRIMLLHSGSVATQAVRQISVAQRMKDEFLFYLRHGYLSWRSSLVTTKEWNQKTEQLFENGEKEFAKQLLAAIKTDVNILLRLAKSVSSFSALSKLFSVLLNEREEYKKILGDFNLLQQIIQTKKQEQENMIVSFLTIAIQWPAVAYAEEEVRNLFTSLSKSAVTNQRELIKALFQSKPFIQQQKNIAEKLQKEGQKIREAGKLKSKKEKKHFDPVVNQQEKTGFASEAETIFISNAGLVILAAFLPAFFEKLQFVNGNQLLNHNDAVCLTHYLATGTKPAEEFELVLPKILCGLQPATVIDVKQFTIKTKWKQETEAVLTSVIEYWNVLGNTSAEGLRESFIKRNGKLSNNGNEWMLQVEQQPYDMLLQHLPWNISMIQFPWMKQMLKTEWIY